MKTEEVLVFQKIKSCTEAIEELQMSLIEPEQKMTTAKQIHGDMPLLDRNMTDTKTIVKNVSTIGTIFHEPLPAVDLSHL